MKINKSYYSSNKHKEWIRFSAFPSPPLKVKLCNSWWWLSFESQKLEWSEVAGRAANASVNPETLKFVVLCKYAGKLCFDTWQPTPQWNVNKIDTIVVRMGSARGCWDAARMEEPIRYCRDQKIERNLCWLDGKSIDWAFRESDWTRARSPRRGNYDQFWINWIRQQFMAFDIEF